MAQHVFVAMPFGRKQDVDFDAVYAEWLSPALREAGFEVFRADEERRAGDIRSDMFQELLLADLVVVDLTLDNPNVWYELGVRHALRARGVLLVQSERGYQPFDIYTERKLRYRIRDGRPDPVHLEADRRALVEMARATVESWHGRAISPVFHLLDGLEEPEWRRLLLSGHNEFRDAYEQWRRRVELARKCNRAGDVLLLADETPTWALRKEARHMAGKALMKLGQYALAQEQIEAAILLDPTDVAAQRDKGILLGRRGRHDEAVGWSEALLRRHGDDPENWCLRGRLEKEDWVRRWRDGDATTTQMRARASCEMAEMAQAIDAYTLAFMLDPSHFYSGINACTLRHLHAELGGQRPCDVPLAELEGGVRWACVAGLRRAPSDYWTRASRAELAVLVDAPEKVERVWREAVAVADKDWFALDSSRQQLTILRDLGFRPAAVAAALAVLEAAVAKIGEPWQPRRVFLFSGHMIDKPAAPSPRFPAESAAAAGAAIAAKLDELGMSADDLAICGGACGGDTLFAEAALTRGCRLRLHLQFREAEFLQASVAFAGEQWVDRFYAIKASALTRVLVQPDELGPPPRGVNPYERNNLWQLYTALAHGADKVRFVSLWNGEGGSGPGGTQHMIDEVRKHAGRVYVLDMHAVSTP